MPTPEMINAWESPLLFTVLAILSITLLAWRLSRRRPRRTETASSQVVLTEQASTAPRCVCGEPATHPAPILARSRGDILRSYFGAPPRYRRSIDHMCAPVYCHSHAHLADLLLDRFVYDLRSEQAAVNVTIGAKAANYEQEGLAKEITERLTDDQKKAAMRRSNNVRSITQAVNSATS